jgi:hypothetical protein
VKSTEVQVGERYATKVGQRLREVLVVGRTVVRGRTRFTLQQVANPGARQLAARTAAALRPLTPRTAPRLPVFTRMSEASAWLRSEGFAFAAGGQRCVHADGREAVVVCAADGYQARISGPTPAADTLSVPFAPTEAPPAPAATEALNFTLLNDVALERLHKHGREVAVREAAGAELERRATAIAAAVDHGLLVRAEVVAAIALRYLRIETLETRNSDRLDFHTCGVAGIQAALEAAYQAGAARALR